MKSTTRNLTLSCSLIGLLGCSTALADPVLDQTQYAFNTGIPVSSPSVDPVYQSFTAGLTGELTDITLADNSDSAGTLTLDVLAGDGTGGALLGSVTQSFSAPQFNPSGIYYPLDLNLSSLGIDVTAGSQYTFEIANASGDLTGNGVLGDTGNPYSGGRYYGGPGYGDQPNWDLSFTTSVDQSVSNSAPDSGSTLGLLGLAFVTLAGLQRKRRLA
jgi:hypothetical protein